MEDRFLSTAWKMGSSGHVGGMIATGSRTTSILGLESRATMVAQFSKPSERSTLLTGGMLLANARGGLPTAWKMCSSGHVGGMIATGLQTTSVLGLESRATIVARFSKPSERSAR